MHYKHTIAFTCLALTLIKIPSLISRFHGQECYQHSMRLTLQVFKDFEVFQFLHYRNRKLISDIFKESDSSTWISESVAYVVVILMIIGSSWERRLGSIGAFHIRSPISRSKRSLFTAQTNYDWGTSSIQISFRITTTILFSTSHTV